MNRKTIILTVGFAVSVLGQCLLFNALAFNVPFGDVLPYEVLKFKVSVLPKLSICIFCAALVPLFKRKWWMPAVSIIFTLWCYAELYYYRVEGEMLVPALILQTGALGDFWDSIFPFAEARDLLLLLPTAFVVPFYFGFTSRERSFKASAVLLVAAVALQVCGTFYYRDAFHRGKGRLWFNPFSDWGARYWFYKRTPEYGARTSVLHCFVHDIYGLAKMPFKTEKGELSASQRRKMARLLNESDEVPHPVTPLFIVLFESLESWAVTPEVMPNLCRFAESENVMWVKNVEEQTQRASSSDARLIVNTGLLPPLGAVVCRQYKKNRFPSLAENYPSAIYLLTGNPKIWNDFEMSEAYGIRTYFSFRNDTELFRNVCALKDEYSYLMAVTLASHTPFRCYNYTCPLDAGTAESMPDAMRRYLTCVHYTDSCMGAFLQMAESDSLLKSATIVITGDHPIFRDKKRDEFVQWCREYGSEYNADDAYCPLVIRSPRIKERTVIEEPTYQMNIYPTILHLIGCDSTYFWKGFGKNLLDPKAKEPVSPEDAYDISDVLIKSDWFKKSLGKEEITKR